MFEDKVINLSCPKCKAKHPKKISWLKAHDNFICAYGVAIRIEANSLFKTIGGVEKNVKRPLK